MQSTKRHACQTAMIFYHAVQALSVSHSNNAVLPTKMYNVYWAIVNYYGEKDGSYYKITCCPNI